MLIDHIRTILLVKLSGKEAPYLTLTAQERTQYAASAEIYSTEQCMNLIDYLVEQHTQIRLMPSGRIALEAILLHILRSHRRIPIEVLVRRLAELEQAVKAPAEAKPVPKAEPVSSVTVDPTPKESEIVSARPATLAKAQAKAPAAPPPVIPQGQYDTVLQFAAWSLKGAYKKHNIVPQNKGSSQWAQDLPKRKTSKDDARAVHAHAGYHQKYRGRRNCR